MAHRFDVRDAHRAFTVLITDAGAVELWLDGCLRKRRGPGARQPRYVWTNIELDWEAHHYVEARYHAKRRQLTVTINGATVVSERLPPTS